MRITRYATVAGIIAAGLLAYSNTFSVPYMRDDIASIEMNPTLERAWPPYWLTSPPALGNTVHGRPILNASFALNRAIFGHQPASYHAVNLAIHIANALLLLAILSRLLPHAPHSASRVSRSAFFISLLFLLHPIQTEAVTYLVQRAESLAAFFVLLTLYALLRHTADSGRHSHQRLWAVLAISSCAVGMATKEIVVATPLLALALDRIFLASSWREVWRRRGTLHAGLILTLAVQAALLLRFGRLAFEESAGGARATPWEYLLTQSGVITYYLGKAFWPLNLCFDLYDWPIARSPAEVWPQLLLVGTLALGTVHALARHPRLGFLGLWFFLLLAPSSSILPIEDVAVEHRLYLPLAALCVLTVITIERVTSLPGTHKATARFQFPVSSFSLSLLALALGILAFRRNADYRTDLTISLDTLAKRPGSARAHYDVATATLHAGSPAEALPGFERAIALKPNYAMAYFGRGEARTRLGLHADAVADFTHAFTLKPDYFFIPNNRGLARLELGQTDAAMEDFTLTTRLAPNYGPAWYNRGRVLARRGETDAALADLTRAAQLPGADQHVFTERGNVLSTLNRHPEAIEDFSRALTLAPNDATLLYNRANARARNEDLIGALNDFDAALALRPNLTEALNNRASVRYLVGRTREAMLDLEAVRALGSEPNPELLRLVQDALARGE